MEAVGRAALQSGAVVGGPMGAEEEQRHHKHAASERATALPEAPSGASIAREAPSAGPKPAEGALFYHPFWITGKNTA